MAESDTSVKETTYQNKLGQLRQAQAELQKPLDELPPAIQEITAASTKNEPEAADTANNVEILHVEAELRGMLGKAAAMEAEARNLENEAGDSASTEANQALDQAKAMRGAAKQAQEELDAARNGNKRISSAKLKGISATITQINIEADRETSELGAATSEAPAHKASRTAAKSASAAKSTPASRLSTAFLGGKTAGYSASHGRRSNSDDVDENEFHPLMNRHDPRNHDGKVRPREVFWGGASLIGALGSKKKRAAYGRLVGEMQDAVDAGDRTGMIDTAQDYAVRITNTTGSKDLGDVAGTLVGSGTTKTYTARNLVINLDVGGALGAAGRLVNTWGGIATDFAGMNTLANNIRQLEGKLEADRIVDWEKLIYDKDNKQVRQFDFNGDGTIDEKEIIGVLRNSGKASMDAVDKDHNGTLSYGELRGVLYEIVEKNHAHVEGGKGLAPLSKPAQSHEGTKIKLDTYKELKTIKEACRSLVQDHHVKVDSDGNGIITYREAFAAVKEWNATHADGDKPHAPSHTPAKPKARNAQAPGGN